MATPARAVDPVDEVPPLRQLIPLGLQHVLALYAGPLAAPVIVGGALIEAGKLNPADLPYLVNAGLLVAGIGTLIQSIGFWCFGVRLPPIQGCTCIYGGFPNWLQTIFNSGISAGALVAIVLNVMLPTEPGSASPGLAAHDAVREQPRPRT